MSLVFDENQGNPVHYPRDPNRFEFDDEVASIFENMAARSIPLYNEVHKTNASLFAHYYKPADSSHPVVVLDLGCSTGMFLKEICRRFQKNPEEGVIGLRGIALDSSAAMLDSLEQAMPWVETVEMDIREIGCFIDKKVQADCINMSYVLQFLPEKDRQATISLAYRILKPNGLFFFSQKEESNSKQKGINEFFTKQYRQFRKDNGYSDKEIEIKTQALKNSMWPYTNSQLSKMVRLAGFSQFDMTTKWLQFTSYCAIK